MSETEWVHATDHSKMVEWLTASSKEAITISDRKWRLFAVACCRHIWDQLADESSRKAVERTERSAEERVQQGELTLAGLVNGSVTAEIGPPWTRAARLAFPAMSSPAAASALVVAKVVETATPRDVSLAYISFEQEAEEIRVRRQRPKDVAALLRDIIANPFRPPLAIDPTWLTWGNGTVKQLAQAVYEERALPNGHLDVARLAVLADALEEAGCPQDHEVLAHLRAAGPHVRGCVAIDLLLNRGGSAAPGGSQPVLADE
jgi:hypothetical protein